MTLLVVAEFDAPGPLLEAASLLRRSGVATVETYSPYLLPEEEAASRGGRLGLVVLGGAAFGLAAGYAMQVYLAVYDYPVNVGGRPLHSAPAFIPIAFEIMVLVAVATAVVATIRLAGMPRLSHPVDAAPNFARASQDRFFLAAETTEDGVGRLRHLLARSHALGVSVVTE